MTTYPCCADGECPQHADQRRWPADASYWTYDARRVRAEARRLATDVVAKLGDYAEGLAA